MHILFAGGGTAGHINPALAVAGYLKEKHPDVQISYIGTVKKLEARLVPEKGYDFYTIDVAGFQRKITPSNIIKNVSAVKKAVTASLDSKKLLKELKPFCVEGEHFFPDDTLTDQPERAVAAELIREKLLRNLRDEIPHGTAVMIELFRERDEAEMVDIEATIVCEREAHKGIIIGKGGAMLKKILTEARRDIERFLGVKVNLQCWVKVREGWRDSDAQLKNFGFRDE